jgi:hypothetical protein
MENNSSKNWLLIENKGEIDSNALILMGGSTKRDNKSTIGFYGSGNKYSIALLLKKNIKFKIFSGEKEIGITTEKVGFRDKSFEKILIDGKETSLTTDMGPQWDTWMVVREFVSNSIDEGDYNIVATTSHIHALSGYTRIYIEHTPEIEEVISNWDQYFAFDRIDALVDNENGKIYPNIAAANKCILYRKGIRCWNESSSLYHYDLPTFSINESRVLDSQYTARLELTRFVVQNATKQVAETIMRNAFKDTHYQETSFPYHDACWRGDKLSKGWREAIGDRIIVNGDVGGFYMDKIQRRSHYLVSKELAKKIKLDFPDVEVYGIGEDGEVFIEVVEELTPKMKYQLKKAMGALEEMKYNVEYPINICKFSDSAILGKAKDHNIYLAVGLFDTGVREIVLTIMEENEHLKTGHSDETRAFQNHLFSKWLSSMEEANGIFL